MKTKINIVEVGPRDGFQNIAEYIPVEEKFKIITGLIDVGIKHLQITSFVSPKAIPQLRDSMEVTKACLDKYRDVDLFALVPNLFGAKAAWELGLKKVAYVISLSESHNKANINRTHKESLEELQRIREALPGLNIGVDMATTFGCPFEGKSNENELVKFLKPLYLLGIREFNLCDTIGVANPQQIRQYIRLLLDSYSDCRFQVHIHDTRNMGIANTLAAIECGITFVQTTLGGLGGCPFAPGASGNTSTEDLVYMLEEMGYDTGINFAKLLELAKYEHSIIKGSYSGHHIHIREKNCEV